MSYNVGPETTVNRSEKVSTAYSPLAQKNIHKTLVLPALPSLTNAAEELAMQFSSKLESQSKSLKERFSSNVRQVEQAEKWMQLLEGKKLQQSDSLAKMLRQQLAAGGGLESLLSLVGKDPAKAALILQHCLELVDIDGGQDKKALLALQKELFKAYGAQINGGLNTAKALLEYTQNPSLLQKLRNLYYKSVVKKRSLNSLFENILELLGEDEVLAGLRTMQRALSDDLNSANPSIVSTPQLRLLVSDLSLTQKLAGVTKDSQELIERMQKKLEKVNISSMELTRRILTITATQLYLIELKRLNQDSVGEEREHHIIFMNALLQLFKRLPMALWSDRKSRDTSITSMLRHMQDETMKDQSTSVVAYTGVYGALTCKTS